MFCLVFKIYGSSFIINLQSLFLGITDLCCCYFANFAELSLSMSKHSSQRSELGLQERLCMTSRGYCLQVLYQCHLSGSGPLTYSTIPNRLDNTIAQQIFLICVIGAKQDFQSHLSNEQFVSIYRLVAMSINPVLNRCNWVEDAETLGRLILGLTKIL